MDDEKRRRQVAENERRLRAVNRRIGASTSELIAAGFGSSTEADFFCACGRSDCSALIRLPVEVYERIHREPHRFIVVPGHEMPGLERVVERHETYDVVEKLPEYRD